MKKVIPIIFMLISFVAFAQNRTSTVTTSSFKPLSYSEISRVATTLQKRYNQNQKYLYDMKKWILELKPQIKEQKFINRLNGEYSVLTSMEDDDLGRATKALKQRENSIREVISEYNTWINTENNKKSNTANTKKIKKTENKDSSLNEVQIALQHFQNKEFALAIRNFSKYLERDSKNTDVIMWRAMAKGELNDYYGAISDYDKVIELNSNYPMQYNKIGMAYNNKAYTFVKRKEYKKALPFIEKALEIDSSDWHFWDTRGEIYLNLGQYNKALSDLNKAIKIEKHSNSYYLRGLTHIKLGKKEKGCKDLSKSGELGNVDAYQAINQNCN
jgi:tetratricopeptide (TPR) repeat protein